MSTASADDAHAFLLHGLRKNESICWSHTEDESGVSLSVCVYIVTHISPTFQFEAPRPQHELQMFGRLNISNDSHWLGHIVGVCMPVVCLVVCAWPDT